MNDEKHSLQITFPQPLSLLETLLKTRNNSNVYPILSILFNYKEFALENSTFLVIQYLQVLLIIDLFQIKTRIKTEQPSQSINDEEQMSQSLLEDMQVHYGSGFFGQICINKF